MCIYFFFKDTDFSFFIILHFCLISFSSFIFSFLSKSSLFLSTISFEVRILWEVSFLGLVRYSCIPEGTFLPRKEDFCTEGSF